MGKVSDQGKNPTFDEASSTFQFSVNPQGTDIFFEVFDKDTFSKDDLMGKAQVRIGPGLAAAGASGAFLALPLTGPGIRDEGFHQPSPRRRRWLPCTGLPSAAARVSPAWLSCSAWISTTTSYASLFFRLPSTSWCLPTRSAWIPSARGRIPWLPAPAGIHVSHTG